MKNIVYTLLLITVFATESTAQRLLGDRRLNARGSNTLELINVSDETIVVEFINNSMAFDGRRNRKASDNTRLFQMDRKLAPSQSALVDFTTQWFSLRLYKFDEKGQRYVYKEFSSTFQSGYCTLRLE
ncbi:MAG: hypothetical protein ACK4WD_05820 [Flavobacteriales bacterium]|jgi:hypothetical protein